MLSYRGPLLIVLALMTAACSEQGATTQVVHNEDQAFDLLTHRLRSGNVYPDGCVFYLSEAEWGRVTPEAVFEFAVHEKHGDGCPGDPATAPVLDRYRVTGTGEILRYDFVLSEFTSVESRR